VGDRDALAGTPGELDNGLGARLESVPDPERELLLRFVHMIQAQRRGGGDAPLAIRSEDLRAIELFLGPSRTADPQPSAG
jgi:hypothetical protein